MTYLKSLKLRGFKSFPRETEIVFGKGFSCIVGPNGAGKSNVTDGILFVLGKLGSKSMRADTSSNLIYNGGKGGRPSSEAVVELCLDNSTSTFPLPEKEIKVSRTVRRKGTSIYSINGKTKTRQEVLELLAKAGITPSGFNIVLQESVSHFVEMRNEDRREIIENISGISVYEERKQKSLRELEKTEQKLKDIGIVLTERGSYLNNLERERKQALLYKKLKQGIEIAKASLVFKQIGRRETEKAILEKRITESNEKVKKANTECQALQKEIETLTEELRNINKKIEQATGTEQSEIRGALLEKRESIAGLQVQKENLLDRLKQIETRRKQLNSDLGKSLSSVGELKEKLEVLPESPEQIQLPTTENILEISRDIADSVRKFKKIKSPAREEIENLCNKIEKLCLNLNKIAKQLKQGIQETEEIDERRDAELNMKLTEKEISSIRLLLKRGQTEKEKLSSELKEVESKIKSISKEAGKKEKESSDLGKQFKKLFTKRTNLEGKLKQREILLHKRMEKLRQEELSSKEVEVENAKISEVLTELEEAAGPYNKYKKQAKTISASEEKLKQDIEKKQARLEALGSINLRALDVYDQAKLEYDRISKKVENLQIEKQEILNIVAEIDRKKKRSFMQTFKAIRERFQNIFARLTEKGQALLEIENPENPFEQGSGVKIRIKIAKGKYLDTRSLSGGEKALTAISLIFAIQEYKPHFFYLLDEVDAALDKRNSERLARLLQDYVKKAQYVCITHNDAMITAADKLYGISMQKGASKVMSLKL